MLRSLTNKVALDVCRTLKIQRAPSPIVSLQCSYQSKNSINKRNYQIRQYSNSKNTMDGSEKSDIKSWVPNTAAGMRKMACLSLLHELTQKQQRSYEAVVDWFLKNMPATYFRQTTHEIRLEHLQAISAIIEPDFFTKPPEERDNKVAARDMALKLQREGPSGLEVTIIQPGSSKLDTKNHHNSLRDILDSLPPADGTLSQVKVFNSMDGALAINVFVYRKNSERKTATAADASAIFEFIKSTNKENEPGDIVLSPMSFEKESLEKYIEKCGSDYVHGSHPRRFLLQRQLYEKVCGTEGVAVDVELYAGSSTYFPESPDEMYGGDAAPAQSQSLAPRWWITLALSNVLPKIALMQVIQLLEGNNIETVRCHLDVVDDPGNGNVTLLRLLVKPADTEKWKTVQDWDSMKGELKRLKWLDAKVTELCLEKHTWMGLERAEVLLGLAACVHGILHKSNPWAYSDGQMFSWLSSSRIARHAASIADLFIERFNPSNAGKISNEEFRGKVEKLKSVIRKEVEVVEAQRMLLSMIDATAATLRTNLFMPQRYALGMRLDPSALLTAEERADPTKASLFGAFFVYGRRFRGFHVRFKDIARGGLRIVSPSSSELVALEQSRHFDEVYNLAFAQQLKNKDIPEGGSKAVILLDLAETSPVGKQFATRKSVKAFTDSLLDLTVNNDETRERVVDFFGKQELLYLGPDEQIVPSDIEWIVNRASRRGLATPQAFMSSKPRSGINHKQYGVTSEGVFVFLDVALTEMGINPRNNAGRPITLKLTGGPDGDVAGNMVKILHREYKDGAKIVAIADGTGCAEDPNGLNLQELLRLVNANQPITAFDQSLLSNDGILHSCDTEKGIRARNSMHSRVQADVFVPAGGRPGTINKDNWREFLSGPEGKPSSSLIVEGANLFVTAEARQSLYDHAGVTIVKDSSANKCGVICSSFEVAVAMLLSEEEFKQNKEAIVHDVLDRLRGCARREAELLFREQHRSPCALPKASEKISWAINTVTDAVSAELARASPEKKAEYANLLLPLFREHLPNSLAELASNRLSSRVPAAYLENAFASCLASKVVYAEGVAFVAAQPQSRLGSIAIEYAKHAADVGRLVSLFEQNDTITAKEKDRIARLLLAGGARTSLGAF